MDATDRIEVVEQQREPQPRIVLRPRGGAATVTLDAAALVAQYAVSETETLLVLDEDTPFEEQLHLALLSDDRLLDRVVIGAPYATGAYRPLKVGSDYLRFNFEGAVPWTLTVRAEGRRGLVRLPPGARRRSGLLAPKYLFLEHGTADE